MATRALAALRERPAVVGVPSLRAGSDGVRARGDAARAVTVLRARPAVVGVRGVRALAEGVEARGVAVREVALWVREVAVLRARVPVVGVAAAAAAALSAGEPGPVSSPGKSFGALRRGAVDVTLEGCRGRFAPVVCCAAMTSPSYCRRQ